MAATLHVRWVLLLKGYLAHVRAHVSGGEIPGFVVADVGIEFGIVAVFLLLLRFSGRWLAAAWICATGILAGLGFGVLLHKGSPLDWSQLLYTVTRFSELEPILKSEFGLIDACNLLFPLLLALLALSRPKPERRPSWATIWAFAGLALLSVPLTGSGVGRQAFRAGILRPFLALRAERAVSGARAATMLPPPSEMFADWRERRADAPRPNFIFILLESVRASATTPYAPFLPTTPFLARMAKQGLLVENAHCLIPHTSKSILTIFAGHPPKLRLETQKTWQLPAGGLPGKLAELGYRSAFFEPATERFEERRLLIEGLGFQEYYSGEDIGKGFEKTHYFGFEDRCLIEPVTQWVAQTRDRPFVLGLINLSTHHDYVLPKSWKPRSFDVKAPPPIADRFQNYLNSVRYYDDVLEQIFTRLDQGGYLSNTIIFFIGDHGEAFGEHGQDGHLDVIWEEALRIPLIMVGPERYLGHPRRIHGPRQSLDILPTVADILGVPNQWQQTSPARGMSLLSAAAPRREIYASSWYQGGDMALLRGGRKFTYFAAQDRLSLFDLVADPGERQDLGMQLSATKQAEVRDAMLGFRAGINAWYREAAADAVQHSIVDELPPYQRSMRVRLDKVLELRGVRTPPRCYSKTWFPLELGFAVRGPVLGDATLELVAVDAAGEHPVTTIPRLDRLPPAQWPAGKSVVLRQRARVESPNSGPMTLLLRLRDASGRLVRVQDGKRELGAATLGRILVLPR